MPALVARSAGALRRAASSRPAVLAVLVLTLAVAVWEVSRLPRLRPGPVLLGSVPWLLGKYVLCPLRWHGVSVSGRGRRWHLRVYAEGELLGLLSPGHAAADVWRVAQLRGLGLDRATGIADVALDRVLGAVGTAVFVLLAGASLPPRVAVVGGLVLAGSVGLLVVVRRRHPALLAGRPRPPAGRLAQGLALSVGYQATLLLLLLGGVAATGASVAPLELVTVFGAGQVAGLLPGLHGAGPKEGALVAGLVSLGVPLGSAVGAVSLVAVAAWGPAILLGGGCLLVRRRAAARGRTGALPVAAS